VHADLHAIGPSIGKQVGMVWLRGAEHLRGTRERRLHAGAHVGRLGGQPNGVNADQRGHPRSQAAHDEADSTGQCTAAVALRRFSSTLDVAGRHLASDCRSSAMRLGMGKVGASVDFAAPP